jgi:hypothetical protein
VGLIDEENLFGTVNIANSLEYLCADYLRKITVVAILLDDGLRQSIVSRSLSSFTIISPFICVR